MKTKKYKCVILTDSENRLIGVFASPDISERVNIRRIYDMDVDKEGKPSKEDPICDQLKGLDEILVVGDFKSFFNKGFKKGGFRLNGNTVGPK